VTVSRACDNGQPGTDASRLTSSDPPAAMSWRISDAAEALMTKES
jgi:hypothetical protein